jgi:peptide-methionine (S)-S-oxide reductase
VYVTAAGYQGGTTKHPTYEEVCTGMTGHTESVLVVFDPAQVSFKSLLKIFWEEHDPTSGMRQGNDIGTQYRSAIYLTSPEQLAIAEQTKFDYQTQLAAANLDQITTEIKLAPQFFYAEIYHQQYLDRVPNGYCGLKGTGVRCIS